ncbi:hypothetical protein HRbin09_01703 [bacterium HR09]|nr:hypothetical protein HRbin09_01703 [bacterium HR09]
MELVTKRKVIGTQSNEPVVLPKIVAKHRRHLHANEAAHLLTDGLDVRCRQVEPVVRAGIGAVLPLVAGVEVEKRHAGLLLGSLCHLHDLIHRLAQHLGFSHVEPGGAKVAVAVVTGVPETAGFGNVNPQVGPLQHTDAGHLVAAGGLPPVPGGLRRDNHRISFVAAGVHHHVAPVFLHQQKRRGGAKVLENRDVAPDVLEPARDHQLQPRAQAGAGAAKPAGVFLQSARRINTQTPTEKLNFQLARV